MSFISEEFEKKVEEVGLEEAWRYRNVNEKAINAAVEAMRLNIERFLTSKKDCNFFFIGEDERDAGAAAMLFGQFTPVDKRPASRVLAGAYWMKNRLEEPNPNTIYIKLDKDKRRD